MGVMLEIHDVFDFLERADLVDLKAAGISAEDTIIMASWHVGRLRKSASELRVWWGRKETVHMSKSSRVVGVRKSRG